MMRKCWSTLGQHDCAAQMTIFQKTKVNLTPKIHSNFFKYRFRLQKGVKSIYFSRFKKDAVLAFKRTFNRPFMCLRSQDQLCCLSGTLSKNVTFEENKQFFLSKIDFLNLVYIIMGWSLSSLDRLRGVVSTLEPYHRIRRRFWENQNFGQNMTVLWRLLH